MEGKNRVEEAIEKALKDGAKIFGQHIMQHILTQQIGRTAIERSLRPTTDYIVKNVLGSKTSSQIVNIFLRSATQSSIYGGAALNHLSKLMRGNLVTMAITTTVLSAGSIYDMINGRISGLQLFKKTFVKNIDEFQFNRDEINYIVGKIFNEDDLQNELKKIYAANNREGYITKKMDKYIIAILKSRPKIKDIGNFVGNYQENLEQDQVLI